MRILVESDYTYYNLGEIAMLQVTVSRLHEIWPGASIHVLTEDPAGLARYCPWTLPVVRRRPPERPVAERSDEPPAQRSGEVGRDGFNLLQRYGRWPRSIASKLLSGTRAAAPGLESDPSQLAEAIRAADLVVVAGMGGITDWFEGFARDILDTMALAIEHGRPTAMLGQGMGPIERHSLSDRASEVLPQVSLIALRERLHSYPLLLRLGVAPERIVITGDDALELPYRARVERLGDGLGLNVRTGWYSGVDDSVIGRLRPVLHEMARLRGAPLVPIPISLTPGEHDALTASQLTAGYPTVTDPPAHARTPLEIIRHIQHCRVVVAGSYHAAVFALGQGVPTVALVGSSYYAVKLEGIADMFGTGCEVVAVDDGLPSTLPAAVTRLWDTAERVRPSLLEASARQIEAGEHAYRRLAELVAGTPAQ